MRWAHLEKVTLPDSSVVGLRSDSIHLAQGARVCPQRAGPDCRGAMATLLPVSAIPAGGAFPTGTAQWEKRNIAQFIRRGQGSVHPVRQVRDGLPARGDSRQGLQPELGDKAPATFQWAKPSGRGWSRIATRCRLRPKIAPAARLRRRLPCEEQERRQPQSHQHDATGASARGRARELGFFLELPEVDRSKLRTAR